MGAEVDYYDPWVPEFKNMYGQSGKSIEVLSPEVVSSYDLVMITTAHHNVDYEMVERNAKVIFDTKNVMKKIQERDKIEVL